MSLDRHPFFTRWNDPVSGAPSFVLTERVAPVQQAFYFVNPGASADERWLWFYCGHPPGRTHTLGVVSLDPARPFIRHFPGAQFDAETPLVLPSGDSCLFGLGADIWEQPVDGPAILRYSLPPDLVANRPVHRIATHLTFSADGRHLILDTEIGNEWSVVLADLADRSTRLLKTFGRKYNHVQFHPTDPRRFVIAQDWWVDRATGRRYDYDWRSWIMDTEGRRFDSVASQGYNGHGGYASHEWWAPDGSLCWVDYARGVCRVREAGDAAETVWGPRPLCHAHGDRSGRYWCADQTPYGWKERPCEVLFFDRTGQRELAIASGLPAPCVDRALLHIDPHPRFTPRDTWINYTTTALGGVDVALTPVESLTALPPERWRSVPGS